jgi:predicted DNA-binding transcriptional regulator AlpA
MKTPTPPAQIVLTGLLDTDDMTSLLKCTRYAIWCAVNRRRADLVPLPTIIRRKYYWRPEDVAEWIDAKTAKTRAAAPKISGRGRPCKGVGVQS